MDYVKAMLPDPRDLLSNMIMPSTIIAANNDVLKVHNGVI